MDTKIQHPKFYPIGSLDDKSNLKQIARVFPDGSIIERVYLDVPDIRYREQLICLHYLKHITRNFLQDYVGVEIISRDNPWDFKIKLNNECVFNIEITSIADNSKHFENNKKEERLARWCVEEKIPLYELIKLVKFFPDENISRLIDEIKNKGISPNELVPNPYYPPKKRIIFSTLEETEEKLTNLLVHAIEKKAHKRHDEKENTVIIIDNRTGAYDVPEYFEALNNISPLANKWPFPEIWFYTGYYSDDSGNNAEFSFSPLKVTPKQNEILEEMTKSGKMDKDGRYVW